MSHLVPTDPFASLPEHAISRLQKLSVCAVLESLSIAAPGIGRSFAAALIFFFLSASALPILHAQEQQLTARLGTYYCQLAPAELKNYGISEPGAVIVGVYPGTAADQAGLKSGDLIVEFNGKPTKSDAELFDALKGHAPGDEVTIVFLRRGERSTTRVHLSPLAGNSNAETFKVAETGLAWAQDEVGEMYAGGKGTKKDEVKARYWYRKAADNGLAVGERNFGAMLELGRGGEVDLPGALQWYEKAAAQGDPIAERFAALLYVNGRGCTKNPEAAARLYKDAALQGDVWSQNNYAEMLWYGSGVVKDPRAAAEWFEKAAKSGNNEAKASLGQMYLHGDTGSKNEIIASWWLKPAAEAGIARAQHSLGYMYEYGKGVSRDLATAAKWFRAAADKGLADSQTALGVMYYYETDPPDYRQAFDWVSKAAQQGDVRAINMLGTIYNEGRAVPRDANKAFEYFRQAAQSGDPVFRYNLGLCYSQGWGVEPDFAEAIKLLRPAAENGVPNDPVTERNAQEELGELYYTGDKHVAKNMKEAMRWFEKAARAGHLHAQEVFGMMLADHKRYKEAAKWYREAAEKGDALAQNNLGILYANGWGVPKSRKDAIAWLLRAYQQGYTNAKNNLKKLGVDAQ